MVTGHKLGCGKVMFSVACVCRCRNIHKWRGCTWLHCAGPQPMSCSIFQKFAILEQMLNSIEL